MQFIMGKKLVQLRKEIILCIATVLHLMEGYGSMVNECLEYIKKATTHRLFF